MSFLILCFFAVAFSQTNIQIDIAIVLMQNDTTFQDLYAPQYQSNEVCRCVWDLWRDRVMVRGGINIGNDTHYIPNFVHYIHDLTLENATLIVDDIANRGISVAFMSLFTSANITTLLAEASITTIHLDSTMVVCKDPTLGCVKNGALYPGTYYPIAFPDQSFTMSTLRLSFLNGARTVAFLGMSVSSGYYKNIIDATIVEMNSTLDIKQVIAPQYVGISASQSEYANIFRNLSTLNPDILMIAIRDLDCPQMFAAFKEVGWTPKTAYTSFCHSTSLKRFHTYNGADHFFTGPTLLFGDYLALDNFTQLADTYIPLQFEDRNYNDPNTIVGYNASEPKYTFQYFAEDFARTCGHISHIDNYSTRTLDCMMVGEVFEEAMIVGKVPSKLPDSLLLVAFKSVYSYTTFTKKHTRDYSGIVDPFQINAEGDPRLVGSIWATSQFVYPMPTFEERLTPSISFLPAEIAIFVLTGIAIVICLAALVCTILFRNYPVIRASSPIFLGILCVGCAIAVSSNFFFRYSYIKTYDCYLHIWFLAIGYIISYGALFVRTLKIDRLWNAQTIDGVELSDPAMIVIFSILVGIQCCLCGLWSGIARPEAVIVCYKIGQEERKDLLRPSENYYQCISQEGGGALIGIIVGFSALILFIGSVLAYRVRSVPMKVVNESKVIAISVYNLLIISVIILILTITGVQVDVLFVIKSVLVICAVLSTIALIFISKITADVRQDKKFGSSVGTVATMLSGNTTTGTTATTANSQ